MMNAKHLTNIPLQISRVLAGLNNLSARDLTELDLTPQSARALVVLLQHSRLRCALMARLLGLEATALSHLLRAMSREQLIVRNRVENDNRAVEVTLTARGTRVAAACQSLAQAHERQLLDGLAPGDLAQLDRILNKLCDNVTPPERRIKNLPPELLSQKPAARTTATRARR
jgi:MarR family transcriptional regulator, organic hydroperoxide resistance regulator